MSLSYDTKKAILTYIYQYVPISRCKFKPLNTVDALDALKKVPHYVTPNYFGTTCYLVFYKEDDTYHSYIVNRQSLKNNFDQLDIDKIPIQPVSVKATPSIYEGTIIEGGFFVMDKKYYFMVNDVFFLEGNNLLKEDLSKKLASMQKAVEEEFDLNKSSLQIIVEKLYKYSELGKLVYKVIPKSEFKIKGLLFYPKISGLRIMYKQFISVKTEDDGEDTSTQKVKESADVYDTVTANFLIKKSKTVDVYPLYLWNKKKLVKQGYASIPTIECSSFCQKLFKKYNKVIVVCHYKKGKWIPVEVSPNTEPDKYNDVIEKIN